MNIEQFAEAMKVSTRTVRNWLNAGLIPGAERKEMLVKRTIWVIPTRAVKACQPVADQRQPRKMRIPK